MLVMLVKPADISPHECAGTYFPTGLQALEHLQSSEFCRTSGTPDCFEILDSAATKDPTKYEVRLK